MRGHATTRGQNTFGNRHPAQVFRRGFLTHQNDLLAFGNPFFRLISEENDLARSGTRRGRQTAGDRLRLADGGTIEHRMQQFIETIGINTQQCGFFIDKALLHHLDRRAHECSASALSGTGLQHPEFAFLDGEFNILHILIVVFQCRLGLNEMLVNLWHQFLERRIFSTALFFTDLRQLRPAARTFQGDLLRRADAGYDVFTLRID